MACVSTEYAQKYQEKKGEKNTPSGPSGHTEKKMGMSTISA